MRYIIRLSTQIDTFRIQPLTEVDVDSLIRSAGGQRLHADESVRELVCADYRLGESILELKLLEEEALQKPQRQAKIAGIFQEHNQGRPVIVLDTQSLPEDARRRYFRVIEGPIKTAIAKAKRQLRQSGKESSDASCSVLLVINNGYSSLDHEALVRLVAHRVRQDTAAIDSVVVAGCYFYSDEIDSYYMWPIEHVPINLGSPFHSYPALKRAWDELADVFMTSMKKPRAAIAERAKSPIVDIQIDYEGVTYVKPSPPMGQASDYYSGDRPRSNSSGVAHCPPVARTVPNVSMGEWDKIRQTVSNVGWCHVDYANWQASCATDTAAEDQLKPLVRVPVLYDEWLKWCKHRQQQPDIQTIGMYANATFDAQVRRIVAEAREIRPSSVMPLRYVLVRTELIGKDCANDVSNIYAVSEWPGMSPRIRTLVRHARIFFEHALVLGGAFAIQQGIDTVLWERDRTYAWV